MNKQLIAFRIQYIVNISKVQ